MEPFLIFTMRGSVGRGVNACIILIWAFLLTRSQAKGYWEVFTFFFFFLYIVSYNTNRVQDSIRIWVLDGKRRAFDFTLVSFGPRERERTGRRSCQIICKFFGGPDAAFNSFLSAVHPVHAVLPLPAIIIWNGFNFNSALTWKKMLEDYCLKPFVMIPLEKFQSRSNLTLPPFFSL